MDLDDLFGDGTSLSIPSRPPSKELHQRLDELRSSGCYSQIAWSKWGSIASVASDGYSLEIRNLRYNPSNGTWGLSEPSIPNFSSTQEGGPLRHLSWSPTGCDLAVIDSVGRVTILTIFSSLNKLSVSRNYHLDLTDDLYTVAGSYWLPLAPIPPGRPAIINGPATNEGGSYRYEASQAPILGPCHPNHHKSAFVFVTTNGLLKLLWPQNNKWRDIHTELESIMSSDDLITHAAICPDKNQNPHGILMIAFATASKQLRTVRALIDWNLPKVEKVPVVKITLNPTIKTKHLAVTTWAPEIPLDVPHEINLSSSMAQLSHIRFLQPASDSNANLVPPTILTARSYLPIPSSQFNSEVQTVFDRWEVSEKQLSLHPAFEQLGIRRNNAALITSVPYLKKVESVTVNKIALGVEVINYGKIIFISYSDGSIEYRERVKFKEIYNDGNVNKVWHLFQIGYVYGEAEPCLQIALSPTQSSLVILTNSGKVKWKPLEFLGDIGTSMNDSLYAATIAAFSLQCGTAVMRNSNFDDLLAVVNRYSTPQFAYDCLTELSRILKLHVDYTDDIHHDVLVRNTTIQLCLSIQNSLGFRGEFKARTFAGKNAWLVLQLRNIVVLVTMAANLVVQGNNPNEKVSPLEDPEIINSLAGSVKWVIDLLAWLVDTLLALPRTLPANIDLTNISNLSLPDLLAYLHSKNIISLHFVLASSTRGFLTAICRRLQHLDYVAQKAIMLPSTPGTCPPLLSHSLRVAYKRIASLLSNSILKFETVEKLLTSISSHVKTAYANHTSSLGNPGHAEKARNILEIKIMFGGSFPDGFKSVIVELYRSGGLLDTVRAEIDEGRLFFLDFSLLQADDDEASIEKRKTMNKTMDYFKRVWLENPPKKPDEAPSSVARNIFEHSSISTPGGSQSPKWRRCTRCAAVSEDVMPQRQSLQWLVMHQRRCLCSGYWNTLPLGEMVA
ncbi:hypothetical protein K3495_g7503 [Podosphaera aphanis]|nr:hypothetical protein K3495_g7503 [Podosphaera aphanis]